MREREIETTERRERDADDLIERGRERSMTKINRRHTTALFLNAWVDASFGHHFFLHHFDHLHVFPSVYPLFVPHL